MLFSDVAGQEHFCRKLTEGVAAGRISHALLFTGPPGAGKLALSLAYATYVNCINPGPEDSCGTCSSCIKNAKLAHPDLHFVFPVNTNKEVKKDASSDDYLPLWRETLLESPYLPLNAWYEKMEIENKQGIISTEESAKVIRKLSLMPYEGKFKIMLIWMAGKMNTEAANRLLKMLEEPPAGTLFLLVSESPEDLLPTIVSRTQNIHLPPLPDEVVEKHLANEFELSAAAAGRIARLAAGDYGHAREIAQGTGGEEDFTTHFISWMRLCYSGKIPELLGWVQETADLGREKQKAFLIYAMHIVRESLNLHFGSRDLKRISEAEEEFMTKFHVFINGVTGPVFAAEFNEAYLQIERNANPKILFLDLSLRCIRLLKSND